MHRPPLPFDIQIRHVQVEVVVHPQSHHTFGVHFRPRQARHRFTVHEEVHLLGSDVDLEHVLRRAFATVMLQDCRVLGPRVQGRCLTAVAALDEELPVLPDEKGRCSVGWSRRVLGRRGTPQTLRDARPGLGSVQGQDAERGSWLPWNPSAFVCILEGHSQTRTSTPAHGRRSIRE